MGGLVRSFTIAVLLAELCGCGRLGFGEANTEPDAATNADASSGPAADGPLAGSCADGALVCDGFESEDLSSWMIGQIGGSVELSTAVAFSGNSSIRFRTEAAGGVADMSQEHAVITSGVLYSRAYWYLPSSLVATGLVELTNAGDVTANHTHFALDGDVPLLLVNDISANNAEAIPRDTWLCVEVDITLGPMAGSVLRVDGTVVAVISNLDTIVPGGYALATFGALFTAEASGPFEVFMDEVAVATTPIGCL